MQDELYGIIADICYFEKDEMHPALSVVDDLAISSVMIVEIIAMIEARYGFNIEEQIDELLGCELLGDMTTLITRLGEDYAVAQAALGR
ncbi:acyl carrier protein [Paenibacillus lutimineralis]|uniref:Acyl carrier protein n=1 Tax=Paenibacillus lutimineralis TaxID=2707005 RepID=A0A3S9UUZ9_9BACL|nr:acyl carrier protein [Paenibacillus lutimineralis]AZS14179.1 acyl carrier protein [Paenibacillus lutimineralis]